MHYLAFNANFNLLMPFALNNCDALTGTDLTKCVKNREKMIVLMIAMQSMAPGSPLTSEQLLPLILMKDGQSNEGTGSKFCETKFSFKFLLLITILKSSKN